MVRTAQVEPAKRQETCAHVLYIYLLSSQNDLLTLER